MKNIFFVATCLVSVLAYAQHLGLNQLKNTTKVSFANNNSRFAQEQLPQVSQQNEWNIAAGSR